MAGPIYSVFMMKYTDAWYKLSADERAKLAAQGEEALKKVGGERLVACVSVWCSEEWLGWGVEKYPDIDAVQNHAQLLWNFGWYNYIESKSYLGVEMPPM
jgi:hypothetical protein